MDERRNVYQRVNAVMKAVANVVKEDMSTGLRYRYISYNQVVAKIREFLVAEGLVISYDEISQDQIDEKRALIKFRIEIVNIDNPLDKIVSTYSGIGIGTDDKTIGKALSYSQKNHLLKTFSLIGAEDDEPDANQDTDSRPVKVKPKPTADAKPAPSAFQPAVPAGGFPAFTRK